MPRTLTLTAAFAALFCLAALPAQAKPAKKPKYFIAFRETLEAPGVSTGMKDRVKPLLLDELRKYPEFVLELPDAPADPAELQKYFKKKKLQGYEVNIRLTKLKQEVTPPKPGEKHKTLSVTVAATIFGTSFPQKSFAIGGDGESTVAISVRHETQRDVDAVKHDALKDAIQQAVVKTLRSLEIGVKPPAPEKRKKK